VLVCNNNAGTVITHESFAPMGQGEIIKFRLLPTFCPDGALEIHRHKGIYDYTESPAQLFLVSRLFRHFCHFCLVAEL